MKKACRIMSLKLPVVFFAVGCLVGAFAVNGSAGAESPVLKLQNPGFYRTMVGDFEVTALSDGTNKRSIEAQLQLLQGNKDEIITLLNRFYPDGQIDASTNAYLINTGSKLVLVDAGNGSFGSPSMGNVVNNLRAAGYQPEKIDEIYLTHMHGDHVGGLLSGSERAFPNATVFANKIEAEYWLNDSNLNSAPDSVKRTFQAAKTAITPYMNAGKFKTFEGNANLTPGIRAEALFGHTPGHTGYFIENKGKTLILWGDIVHVAAVQFADPSVTLSFDSDKVEAAKARQQILTGAAAKKWLIGGVHISFPGLGYVRTNNDKGYVFLPLE